MLKKMVEKIIDWTSLVEIDDEGNEYKIPWSLEEFVWGGMYILGGFIMGILFMEII